MAECGTCGSPERLRQSFFNTFYDHLFILDAKKRSFMISCFVKSVFNILSFVSFHNTMHQSVLRGTSGPVFFNSVVSKKTYGTFFVYLKKIGAKPPTFLFMFFLRSIV